MLRYFPTAESTSRPRISQEAPVAESPTPKKSTEMTPEERQKAFQERLVWTKDQVTVTPPKQ
jgi:hypothetical protein